MISISTANSEFDYLALELILAWTELPVEKKNEEIFTKIRHFHHFLTMIRFNHIFLL